MKDRISRFTELKPLPIQNPSIPEKARDVVYARKLLSVIGLDGDASPINAGAPIVGDALSVAAGWLRMNWMLVLAFMAAGRFARYLVVAAVS